MKHMKKSTLSILVIIGLAVIGGAILILTPKSGAGLSEADARAIAEQICIKGGEALSSGGTFNENSKTWWFDANLNATQTGCNPACVVSEETKTAEINWRCTGLISDSGVRGKVLLGPVCPVMRDPPDPQCADKSYQTTVQVIKVGSPKSSPFATVETDKEGRYEILLPPGDYALQPIGGSVFPRCETKEVTVIASEVLEADLSCDTGIR